MGSPKCVCGRLSQPNDLYCSNCGAEHEGAREKFAKSPGLEIVLRGMKKDCEAGFHASQFFRIGSKRYCPRCGKLDPIEPRHSPASKADSVRPVAD